MVTASFRGMPPNLSSQKQSQNQQACYASHDGQPHAKPNLVKVLVLESYWYSLNGLLEVEV